MFIKLSPYFSTADASGETTFDEAYNHETNESVETKSPEQTYIEKLEAEVAALTAKCSETHERMMRVAADADNTRKRLEKEKMESRIYAIQDFAKDLLPVVDAFDKAITTIDEANINFDSEEGKKIAAIIEGVQLVTKAFQDATKKHGIERLPGKGTPFNPMFHNAIAKVSDASLTTETVIDEYMSGYKIGERILRTAMVRVGSPD